MTRTFVFLNLLVILVVGSKCSSGSALSSEANSVYNGLQQALINGNTSSVPNLQVLANAFFPKGAGEPVCVPIQYTLLCNNSNTTLEMDFLPLNYSFLWTANYFSFSTGVLLLSYSQSGITLKGFEWERSCVFVEETELELEIDSFICDSHVLNNSLEALTSQLKAFADAQEEPKPSNSYRGHALNWNNSKKALEHYDIIFTIHIILLNIFIFCSSLVSSNSLYQKLYKNVAGRRNPGYSFFWAIVILSILWNIAPSWLVLSKYDNKVYCSLAVMIPLQLLVALLVRKKCTFPIPGLKPSTQCVDDIHSLNKSLCSSYRNWVSHIIQVLSLWSLLITYTFFMHYLTSVVLALYIDPLNSLVKIVFVKAVIVCFVIATALLFAVDVVSCQCSANALTKTLGSFLSVLTILCLLPLVFFLVFMIGGIVFNNLPDSNSWKAIFSLIPSAALLYASWFSHGLLFPKGLTDPGNAADEIVHDLEGSTAQPANPAHTQVTMDEATPLLPRSGSQGEESVRSRMTASVTSNGEKKPRATDQET